MRLKKIRQSIWPVSVFGLGCLLLIIGVAGVANLSQSHHIYREIIGFEDNYRRMEELIEDIRFETLRVGEAPASNRDLSGQRERVRSLESRLRDLRPSDGTGALSRLAAALDKYFGDAPGSGAAHRTRIFEITDEIRKLNGENLNARERALNQAVDELQSELWSNLLTALFVGLCIAAAAVFRISELEQISGRAQAVTREAERRLRNLSQQLVSSQEQERKVLSRELHDEIGQSLTALRIELAKLEHVRHSPEFTEHLEETKKLAEQTLQSARAISMGLRPAMLDELGLGPALQWQAREFSRRFQIPVNLELPSDLRDLPDQHRTYLYRIVQECLTNCARHSKAGQVNVSVHQNANAITLRVADDGLGFERRGKLGGAGLGLLGISERVRELGGEISIDSEPGKGTEIRVSIPVRDADGAIAPPAGAERPSPLSVEV
jgi:signal transduction histidine kinase